MWSPFYLTGIGIHTGASCEMHLSPLDIGQGVVFRKSGVTIPARQKYLSQNADRATTLCRHGVQIQTVEHLLSGLMATSASDVLIDVKGPEIPILDGSAKPFFDALRRAGATEVFRFFDISAEVAVSSRDATAQIIPLKSGESPSIRVAVELDGIDRPPLIATFRPQNESFENISSARTFAFEHEVAVLKAAGLAKGGTLENALVLGKHGPLNPEGFRYENEPARHKIVDMIGDLALLGALPWAHIVATRPGHHLYHEIVRALAFSGQTDVFSC